MIIEQPPQLYRFLFPNAIWRHKSGNNKRVYLTFDDGPIPEITPWVLDLLDKYNVKATFFCVGENVFRYPDIYKDIIERGHKTGNHTYNHLQGWQHKPQTFLQNTQKARQLIDSKLFRPPHGHLMISHQKLLEAHGYKLIMWDVVTRDYSKLMSPEKVLINVKKYTRDGSIIVFHDSLKAEKNLRFALPLAVEWLLDNNYTFELIK